VSITSHSQADLRPHIGLGISSFAVGAIGTLSFVLLVVYAVVLHNTGRATAEVNAMIGGGMVLVWTMNLIGIGLGIAAAMDSSKKTFAVLGLVLSFGTLALSAAIVAIGLRMG
jgi:hypothetical protein